MIRRPPRSTLSSSSAASDVYKRQEKTANITRCRYLIELQCTADGPLRSRKKNGATKPLASVMPSANFHRQKVQSITKV